MKNCNVRRNALNSHSLAVNLGNTLSFTEITPKLVGLRCLQKSFLFEFLIALSCKVRKRERSLTLCGNKREYAISRSSSALLTTGVNHEACSKSVIELTNVNLYYK